MITSIMQSRRDKERMRELERDGETIQGVSSLVVRETRNKGIEESSLIKEKKGKKAQFSSSVMFEGNH